ncbi:MAG: hypothetical protein AB1716_10390 [Planctomycetota bacterium]
MKLVAVLGQVQGPVDELLVTGRVVALEEGDFALGGSAGGDATQSEGPDVRVRILGERLQGGAANPLVTVLRQPEEIRK